MLGTPLSDNHYTLIGKITVHSTYIENLLASFISSMVRINDRTGMIITAELNIKQLTSILYSLYKEQNDDEAKCKELREVLNKVEKSAAERNQIVHSVWGAGVNGNVTKIKSTSKLSKGFNIQFQPYTEKMLAEILLRVDEAHTALVLSHVDYLEENGHQQVIDVSKD